jgi:GTP cyclohydrolase II
MQVEISKIAKLPTQYGNFKIQSFKENGLDHFVIFTDPLPDIPFVRIHSECLTGDVFKSIKCDCGEQLDFAMKKIAKDGGMIIYLRQEGRGIGLFNKVNAYSFQDMGYDTIEANEKLGFAADLRKFDLVPKILREFKIDKIKLMTNNPRKLSSLEDIEVVERVPVLISSCEYNSDYLRVKKEELGHLL